MVKYKGVKCELFKHYFTSDDKTHQKLTSSQDIEKTRKEPFNAPDTTPG